MSVPGACDATTRPCGREPHPASRRKAPRDRRPRSAGRDQRLASDGGSHETVPCGFPLDDHFGRYRARQRAHVLLQGLQACRPNPSRDHSRESRLRHRPARRGEDRHPAPQSVDVRPRGSCACSVQPGPLRDLDRRTARLRQDKPPRPVGHRNPGPVAWLTADDGDNDPVVLLTDLAAAIDRVEPLGTDVFVAIASPQCRTGPWSVDCWPGCPDSRGLHIAIDDGIRITTRPCLDILAELVATCPRHRRWPSRTRADRASRSPRWQPGFDARDRPCRPCDGRE